jgi:Right handed beta helix region
MTRSNPIVRMTRACLVLFVLLGFARGATAQTIIYRVNDNPPNNGNTGVDWNNAIPDLSDALGRAHDDIVSGAAQLVQVWVAEGTYQPSAPPKSLSAVLGDRGWTFEVHHNVELYGAFAGTEGGPTFNIKTDRQGDPNLTILDGDIGTPLDQTDIILSVVRMGDATTSFSGQRVDGFLIQHGFAFGTGNPVEDYGAGIRAWNAGGLVIANCTMTDNEASEGGGAYIRGSNFNMKLCTFDGNRAHFKGAGLYVEQTDAPSQAHSVVFRDNSVGEVRKNTNQSEVDNWRGGAIYAQYIHERFTVANGLFTGNRAGRGGAVYVGPNGWGGDPGTTWVNNTFSGNYVHQRCVYNIGTMSWDCDFEGEGAAFYFEVGGATHRIENSVVWGNPAPPNNTEVIVAASGGTLPTVSFSDIETGTGTWPGSGNINADPLFTASASGNYTLKAGSPCLDAGDNPRVPQDWTDLDDDNVTGLEVLPFELQKGSPRIFESRVGQPKIVDMGAYEFIPAVGI